MNRYFNYVIYDADMRFLKSISLAMMLSLICISFSYGQTGVVFVSDQAIVCPASESDKQPPLIRSDCEKVILAEIDPQGKHIWAIFKLYVPTDMLDLYEPLGLGISAKASSVIYINNNEVGRNGLPSDARQNEIPGRMDVVYPLRPSILKSGENEVALRLSSHKGYLNLKTPVHSIYLSAYEQQQSRRLRRYAPSIFPFGIFVIGALYFSLMTLAGRQKTKTSLLAALSIFIAGQLIAEISRGIFAYPYPLHDLRLLAILICAIGFSIFLSLYVLEVFGSKNKKTWRFIIMLVALFSMYLPEGYDFKATISLLSQTCMSLLIVFLAWKKDIRRAVLFICVLSVFGLINILGKGLFLDIYFFYAVALLLLFLFAQQALDYGREQNLRQQEEIRANKLQLILDQKDEVLEPTLLSLSEAGKIHRINAADIVSMSGAGDYVEFNFKNGKSRLITTSLSDMETQLPSHFLRIHRSHIVNTNYVKRLERDTSGTGRLMLERDISLPVSRRIMPAVRKVLA